MKAETISLRRGLIGLLTIVLCFSCFSYGTISWAQVPLGGEPPGCSLCHDGGGPHGPETLSPGYQGNQGCINCHSSDTSSTTYDLTVGVNSVTVPVVLYTGAMAPTEYLAGGNFWWVKEGLGGDDTKGHNTFPGEGDDNLSEAPGRLWPCSGACHDNLSIESTKT
jgi:hypothetical protein